MIKILVVEDLSTEALPFLNADDLHVDLCRPTRAELLNLIGDYEGLIVRWLTRVDDDLLSRDETARGGQGGLKFG